MNCDEVQERLSSLIDGQLDESEVPAVEAHLAVCNVCRDERAALEQLDAALTRALAPERWRAVAIADHVLRKDAAGDVRSSRTGVQRPLRRVVEYLAAAAAGFLLAFGLIRSGGGEGAARTPGEQALTDSTTNDGTPQRNGIAAPVSPVAYVVHATGPLSYRSPKHDNWISIDREKIPTFMCPADTAVRTEPGALCELRTTSGSRIRMNEASEVAFHSDQDLELAQGQIWCRTDADNLLRVTTREPAQAPSTGIPWTLLCPTSAECFTSRAADGPLQVVAAAGTLDVTVAGTPRELKAGTTCTVTGDAVEIRDAADELLDAERWMQPLLTLEGHNNPELSDRVDALLARVGRTKLSFLFEQDLRNLGEYGAIPLLRYVQSDGSREEQSRRVTAMRIIADTTPVWTIPDLIELLEDDDPQVRQLAAHGLARLTGQTQGISEEQWGGDRTQWSEGVRDWQHWWQTHRYSCSPAPAGIKS